MKFVHFDKFVSSKAISENNHKMINKRIKFIIHYLFSIRIQTAQLVWQFQLQHSKYPISANHPGSDTNCEWDDKITRYIQPTQFKSHRRQSMCPPFNDWNEWNPWLERFNTICYGTYVVDISV